MALLDYKVSTGYNFDEKHEKEDERRVADTFPRGQPQLQHPWQVQEARSSSTSPAPRVDPMKTAFTAILASTI